MKDWKAEQAFKTRNRSCNMFLDRTGCLDRTLFCLKAYSAFLSFKNTPKNLSRNLS